MPTVVCFEDEAVFQLHPITIARPAYAVSCASYRLIDWVHALPGPKRGAVRPHLQVLQQLDYGLSELSDDENALEVGSEGVLLVNARMVPSVANGKQIQQAAKRDDSFVILDPQDGSVLIARITGADLNSTNPNPGGDSPPEAGATGSEGETRSLLKRWLAIARQLQPSDRSVSAFHFPHEVVGIHVEEMPQSMNHRLANGSYREIRDGVFAGEGVQLGEYPVVDTSDGPIVLEDRVNVGPFCYLAGPVYAGANSRIIEHAALKDAVSLGHTVKIGGEVEASVIEPYTNKQHHGFLGHSYLGSWINLGAGTCNSDLKNTYGKINMEYGNEKVATGMQFLGCFIGDYSKSAINTSIFTGKVVGVCSMMYGFVTSNVPSYVNYARLFGQTSLLPADVMIKTQQRMFERRKVAQRECDKQLIRDMYELTSHERDADPDRL